eukprot:INCI573.1.p1 GENE.INCI573.1~~INCI573.1.p1  ORF type:complete len:518 (+),score=85.71 INCI573.1:300-1853(+)
MSQKNLAQGELLDNFVDDSEEESNVSTDSDIVLTSTSPRAAAATKHFTPLRLLIVFTFVNVLNYVDRGIVSGAGTTIEGCDADCTSPTDFCWDNVTQRSCGKHYFRKFCSALGQTCAFQFGPDVPMCAGGFPNSINDDNCTDPTNLTACPPCCTTQTGFSINTEELGWLQFAFLIGYMPAMLIFGHMVRNHKPFTLMGSGLTIWCCAVLASGFAGPHFFDSYIMLLIARAVSGVGEASFQCIGPPFIDDYAPKAQKGVWLAVFYSAIPCGTALGFVWAGEIAKALSWEYAFIIECPIMLPIAIMCFFIPLDLKNKSGVHGHGASSHDDVALDVKAVSEGSINDATADQLLTGAGSGGVDADDFEDDEASYDPYGGVSLGDDDNDLKEGLVDNIYSSAQRKKMRAAMRKKDKQKKKDNGDNVTLWEQIRPVITVPTFLLVTFGYAGYSAVTAGFAFYGPIYVQQSFCEFTQGSADLIFGGIIVVAGLVGTPLGGYVFDLRVCAKDGDSPKYGWKVFFV